MKENIELPEELVSVKTKLSFSIGGLANGLLNGLVFSNLTFFYQIKLGADAGLLMIGWLIFAIWNKNLFIPALSQAFLNVISCISGEHEATTTLFNFSFFTASIIIS